MSRIGKLPINIPKGVKIDIEEDLIKVTGPKGTLEQVVVGPVKLDLQEDKLYVSRIDESKASNVRQGLYRALINNMVIGVTQGFERTLLITGVGYRAEVKDDELLLNLGYSHQIKYKLPPSISAEIQDRQTKVIIRSIDKQLLGQVAAKIRNFRPPDSYKGKGIRYDNERVVLKAGKAGKKK